MSERQKSEKRIVSKEEYARLRIRLLSLQIGAFLIAMLFMIVVAVLCSCIINPSVIAVNDLLLMLFLVFSLFASLFLFLVRTWAMEAKSHELKSVRPFTRAHADDLPAAKSLVRASQEPHQAQQAVLLRATTKTTEKHEEQLLRASAEGQESA